MKGFSQEDQQTIYLNPLPYSFTNKYCIGQGSFGKVYKGLNIHNNQPVAIKQLQLSNNLITEDQINKQIAILKKLDHPNIVRYEATLKTTEYFYIITQYCNGGDLRNLLEESSDQDDQLNQQKQKKTLEKLTDMFFQVCAGFTYLRKFDIIHRDLKPSNILIHNNIYKIADFGVAKTQQLNKSLVHNDIVGVPMYMSPQILSRNYYSYKCDIWSLGIILYEYYFQKMPWKATDVNGLFFQILSSPYPYLEQQKKMSPLLNTIFQNTLRYLQNQRMSWDELFELKKSKRKIFNNDFTQSKSHHKKSERNIQKEQVLSASRISKMIPPHEAQILTHIICQLTCNQTELKRLVGSQCYQASKRAIQEYILNGPHYRQLFTDSSFFFLRLAGQNLHMYMIDLDNLDQARVLLVFLQILHDLATLNTQQYKNFEQFKNVMENTCSKSSRIQEYAAYVISKINTYRLKNTRQ